MFGSYTFTVTATDPAGKTYTQTAQFEVGSSARAAGSTGGGTGSTGGGTGSTGGGTGSTGGGTGSTGGGTGSTGGATDDNWDHGPVRRNVP